MSWNLDEALAYYKKQGAPGDQRVLVSLLQEVQQEHGGSIPRPLLEMIAGYYGLKESLLLALIRRMPRLRLSDTHSLELCAGPNCGKHASLAACAEKLHRENPAAFTFKYVPCMRQCGKGPNIRWDGVLYNRADEELLRKLIGGNP